MRSFSISFNDLSFEKKQEMIEEIKQALLEQYKEEAEKGPHGKNFGIKEYQNMTWQEAFVREYAIDFRLWEDKNFDWNFAVEQYAEEKADDKCYEGMRGTRVEVKI